MVGIAVANSDFDSTAGKMQIAANKNANHTDDPVFAAAIPGKTKIPPSIPAILIAIIADNVNFLSSFFNLFSFNAN